MASLDRLSTALSKLPGIGRRSAERMALRLVLDRKQMMSELIAAMDEAQRELCCCSQCGSITSVDSDPCDLCSSPQRDDDVLCVVETPNDIMMIERSGGFHGRYHALMGNLSPMKGNGVSDLRFDVLRERMSSHKFSEVILALSTDVEGDSTAAFITESLKGSGVKVSRLASGLPSGSGIIYSDSLTLSRALDGRTEVKG